MAFHTKYRPNNLDKIVGHEAAVTRLRGMIAKNDLPNALAFFGPSSAGKTTLARAFTAAVNGTELAHSGDYHEVNAAEARTIDDVRQMIAYAKYRPKNKKRIICIDEAQGFLSNAVAAQAMLKPLEEPPKDTIWILCSMDPAKFQSGTGKALANRCSQFVLEPHTPADLLKQALRIAKAEKMTYVLDDERTLLKTLVKNAPEMRSMSSMLESLQQFYEGMSKTDRPKMLDKSHIASILKSSEHADDETAAQVLLGVYTGSFKQVQIGLLDIVEEFTFIKKLLWINNFILNNAVLEGARHPKVWGSPKARQVAAAVGKLGTTLGQIASVNATLVETQSVIQQFSTPTVEMLSTKLYRVIKEIHQPK